MTKRNLFSIIFIIATLQVYSQKVIFNFETNSINLWQQNPLNCWEITSDLPISGSYSLRHAQNTNSASTDTISTSLPDWQINGGKISWTLLVKHGYDPSSSNCWGVWLMSDSQMENGYVVGVNYSGSDDLLKLWKVENGIVSAIISSSINWQNSVTKTGIGAIGVERQKDGKFVLLADTTGNIANLTAIGSATSSSISSFSKFGAVYKYTSSARKMFWIDNIAISYEPANLNDLTTAISTPAEQVAADSISSLYTTAQQAFEVFRFVVRDSATSDNLPTSIKRLVIKNPTTSNWEQAIGGALLKSGDETVETSSIQVLNSAITIDASLNPIEIEDGQAKEFSLWIYLKQGEITDGQPLLFSIATDHGFIADTQGSGLCNELAMPIVSNSFVVDVDATRLNFTSQPTTIFANSPFTIGLSTCDQFNNIDTDCSAQINLSIATGMGSLNPNGSLNAHAQNGVALWNNLIYSTTGKFSISAQSDVLGHTTSQVIQVRNDTTTTIEVATEQPEGQLVKSIWVNPENAFEAIRLRIIDIGNDSVPTYIKSIKLARPNSSYTALNKIIAGVLISSNGYLVPISSTKILSGNIEVFFGENTLVVPNGASLTLQAMIYLRNGGLTDGDSLRLTVEQEHGFTAYNIGSTFTQSIEKPLTSGTYKVSVEATKQTFTGLPERVGRDEHFNIQIGATDVYSNIDNNFSGAVGLSKNLGNGVLNFNNPNTSPFINGVAKFEGVWYSQPGVFNLLAQNPLLPDEISGNITCGDADAEAIPIVNEIDTCTISSTCTSADSAVEIIRFRIADGGLTDELPTIPTRIALNAFNPQEVLNTAKMIGGFVIETSSGLQIPTTFSVSSNKIVIDIPEFDLVIPNNDSLEMSIKLFLNEEQIISGTQFRFYISASSHGFQSSTSGTNFQPDFEAAIYGKPCKINVEAVKMMLSSYPFIATKGQAFSITAFATDKNGNIDTNLNGKANISIYTGDGLLAKSSIETDIANGVAQWTELKLDTIDTYQLKILATGLQSDISQEIIVGYNPQTPISEDFEEELPTWNGMNSWKLTTANPISGQKSLVHIGNSSSTQNYISFDLDMNQLGRAMEWRVTLRNGDWDPSSTSLFYMVLAATSENYESANGLAMGICPSTGNDLITLWKFNGTKRTPLITSTFDWNSNDEVTIWATLTPQGKISLWHRPSNSQLKKLAGSANVGKTDGFTYGGFVYTCPETRTGQLWIDDVQVKTISYPPQIESVNPLGLSTVNLYFNKEVNSSEAQRTNSYRLVSQGMAYDIEQVILSDNGRCAQLSTQRLPLTELTLYVSNISDLYGYYINDSINFSLAPCKFGTLVINEIMANPTNPIGLPEYEYIELYNPTTDTVDVQGWKLRLNNSTVSIPKSKIGPKSYAIICPTNGATLLSQFGQCIATSLPAIANEEMLLKLIDHNGNLISFVNYNKNWYAEAAKENGGYSLERIDALNPAEEANNWHASNANIGGTPCAQNSIATDNPDVSRPTFTIIVQDAKTLTINFSEPMDTLNMTYTKNFLIDNSINNPLNIAITGKTYNQIQLTLLQGIEVGTLYTLSISNAVTDFCGNELQSHSAEFILPHTPLGGDVIINEVLFNPYSGGVDFVEVYNKSDKTFDLGQMRLCNRSTSGDLASIYPASDSLHLLLPNSYGVITTNPALVEQFYWVQNPSSFATVSKMASYNAESGCVVLLDLNHNILDEFQYTKKMHNRLLTDVKGISLERVSSNRATQLASNWQSAAQTAGFATPTYKNSQYSDSETSSGTFTLSPETFSPDGDGRDDQLHITYNLPEPGFVANIRIFNASGVEVCRLANNATLGTSGEFRWDGENSNNQRVPIGIYVVLVEYNNLNGSVTTEKLVCVVAKR